MKPSRVCVPNGGRVNEEIPNGIFKGDFASCWDSIEPILKNQLPSEMLKGFVNIYSLFSMSDFRVKSSPVK